MQYPVQHSIIENSISFSFRKSENGSATLSFSTFNTALAESLNNEYSRITFSGLSFRLVSYNRKNHVHYLSFAYDANERSQVVTSVVFDTINTNLKKVYDSAFNYYSYLANYQEGGVTYHIMPVDNLLGIDGWSASDILRIATNMSIHIPPGLDYRLKSYRVSAGQSIFSLIASLFPKMVLIVTKLGHRIHVRTLDSFCNHISVNGITCFEATESKPLNIDDFYIRGAASYPTYISGGGGTVQVGSGENTMTVQLNKIGREFLLLSKSETHETTIAPFKTDPVVLNNSDTKG